VSTFDLPGTVRRIRRIADLSQRELAAHVGLSASAIGHAETGVRDLPVRVIAAMAALAGLRLALVDGSGEEVGPMSAEAVRDKAGRRFPAHLDTRYSEEDWWHGRHRYAREQPWYTFDRDRRIRDGYRIRGGTPADHQLPRPGDSPHERAVERQRRYLRGVAEERERRFLVGELRHLPDPFRCTCPPACDELDDWSGRPVHAGDCGCSCDVG
jgi:transcriptional regulator with XRE-family HTH domain